MNDYLLAYLEEKKLDEKASLLDKANN
jgi:hypothetical protein